MEGRKKKVKLYTKNYMLLILTAFIGAFLSILYTSTLPLYAERLTGSTMYAGLVTTVFTVAALASRPITGIVCEKKRHVPMMMVGFFIMTSVCFLYRLTGVITLFLILRALHGVGFGIKTTVSGVLVAENIPQERFAEGIGIYNLYIPLTNALAPTIAYGIIGNGDLANFDRLFILGGVLGCGALILSLFIKERTSIRSGQKEEKKYDDSDLPNTFMGFEKGVITPVIVLTLMYIGQGAILSFIALYSMDSGIGGIGSFFIVNAAALFAARLVFSKCVNKWGYDIPSVVGLVIFAVGLVLIPLSDTIWLLYISGVLLGIAQGIVPMTINAIILQRCSAQRSGTAMAAYTSSMDIGIGLGSILLGTILELTNYICIFSFASICSFAAIAVYVRTLWGNKKICL